MKGGHLDHMRCLFLATALEGAAKTWHDSWTTARETYTSDELLTALLDQFAPQILSREDEARHKLASGKHRMRTGESVAAYRSRFEALVSVIPSLTDSERRFWFHQGLSADLAGDCAADTNGRTFSTYSQLVQYALGVETRLLAKKLAEKQTRPSARLNAVAVQEPSDMSEGEDAPPAGPKQRRAPSVAAAAAAPAAKGGAGERPRKGPGGGARGAAGQGAGEGSGKRQGAASEWQRVSGRKRRERDEEWLDTFCCTRQEYTARKKSSRCLRCGSKQHRAQDCPVLAAEKVQK